MDIKNLEEKRLYAPCVTVAGRPLGEFGAAMQYPAFSKTRSVEPFQGRQRSTLFLLTNQTTAMLMRCKIDFFGSCEDRTMGQSAFEALFQGMDPVKIDVLDGFWYNAVLLSANPSATSHDAMTSVEYEFRVTRHKDPVTVEMHLVNNVHCVSNVDRTDCVITIAAGFFGGEIDVDRQLDLYLNGYCWSIQGRDNPNEEAIILDGVNKRFLIGSTNVAQKIYWTDFPYLIPGENKIEISVNGIPSVSFIGGVAYTPTFT